MTNKGLDLFKPLKNVVKDIILPELSKIEIEAFKQRLMYDLHLLQNKSNFPFKGKVSITPIRCSKKSQIFLVHSKDSKFIIKCISNEDNYILETFAQTLLEPTAPIVSLLFYNDEKKIICYEYLPYPFLCKDIGPLIEVTKSLGKLHTVSLDWPAEKLMATSNYILPTLCNKKQISGFKIINKKCWRNLIQLFKKKFGHNYVVPLAIIDLKAEHLFLRSLKSNSPLFIDLETLSLGIPGLVDLLLLPWIGGKSELTKKESDAIVDIYIETINKYGKTKWTQLELIQGLKWTCTSLGLHPNQWKQYISYHL